MVAKKSTDYSVAETIVEAEAALEKWKRLSKSINMVVDISPGLSTSEESNTCSLFTENGVEDMLFSSRWIIVS
jgi:hypothetical protein